MIESDSTHYNPLEIPERPTLEWAKPIVDKIVSVENPVELIAYLDQHGVNTNEKYIDLKSAIEEVMFRNKKKLKRNNTIDEFQMAIYRCWDLVPEEFRDRAAGKKLPKNIWK